MLILVATLLISPSVEANQFTSMNIWNQPPQLGKFATMSLNMQVFVVSSLNESKITTRVWLSVLFAN